MAYARILIVDDDPVLLQMLVHGFMAHGFEVVTASYGIDAIIQFRALAGEFDAVVTDQDPPQADGSSLLKSLRGLGFRGPVIVMSGHLSSSDARAYRDLDVISLISTL